MAGLETREQALAYLARMSPTETFQVHPFQHGWVCTKVLSPEQMRSGEAVGLARLVIDSETGIVYQYPSWSTTMVAEAHTTFKQTGINRAGSQIYPYQWTITIRRIREDEERIVYQMTAKSLTDPARTDPTVSADDREAHLRMGSDGFAVERGDVARGMGEPSEPGRVAGGGHDPRLTGDGSEPAGSSRAAPESPSPISTPGGQHSSSESGPSPGDQEPPADSEPGDDNDDPGDRSRIYSLMDESSYRTSFAPEQLLDTTAFPMHSTSMASARATSLI
jgi:hypothetical protein